MMSDPKILRPYQARLLTDVCRTAGDVLVEQPTGSGKTIQIVTLVAMQLGRRFTHAVIAAPQEQIEHGFVHRNYQRVAWPNYVGVAAAKQKPWLREAAPRLSPPDGAGRSWSGLYPRGLGSAVRGLSH